MCDLSPGYYPATVCHLLSFSSPVDSIQPVLRKSLKVLLGNSTAAGYRIFLALLHALMQILRKQHVDHLDDMSDKVQSMNQEVPALPVIAWIEYVCWLLLPVLFLLHSEVLLSIPIHQPMQVSSLTPVPALARSIALTLPEPRGLV